jgi:hypothetical protein
VTLAPNQVLVPRLRGVEQDVGDLAERQIVLLDSLDEEPLNLQSGLGDDLRPVV